MNKPARPVKKQKASDTMKHCKQCGAELDDEVQVCPQCGADNAADAPETVTEPAPATEPNSAPEAAPAAADEAKPADAPKNKKSMGALFALCLVGRGGRGCGAGQECLGSEPRGDPAGHHRGSL